MKDVEKDRDVLIKSSVATKAGKEKAGKIAAKASELLKHPKGNPYIQLKEWKSLGKEMIDYLYAYGDVLKNAAITMERMAENSNKNKYLRWTEEEDEKLIEVICSGELSPAEISAAFGRSIPAINSRVSKLVGLKRLSMEVAGKFIGTLNGESVSGEINGTVMRNEE